MSARFGYTIVVPPFAGAGQEEAVVAAYAAALERMGGERRAEDRFDDPLPLFYLIATGGTEGAVLRLQAERQASVTGEPVLLIAHPGNNSLPAALEVLARIQQDGVSGRILYLAAPDDAEGLARVERAVADLSVAATLARTRIGLVGDPSDWLVASMPDPGLVRDAWGPQVVTVSLDDLTARIAQVSADEVATSVAALVGDATDVAEPTDSQLNDVARVHAALSRLAADYELDALTVRCFDLVLELETTGCFALAELTDAGIIAGCEGDLVSTLGLLWTHLLLGEIPWMANPAQVDEAENTVLLAHCTVPRGLVERYRLRSHFESGLGVGIQGDMPLGPVTLVRIGGKRLEKVWLAEGAVVAVGDAENLCRTQASVALSQGHVRELLNAPLGNHIVLVRGHHADRLRAWWEMLV